MIEYFAAILAFAGGIAGFLYGQSDKEGKLPFTGKAVIGIIVFAGFLNLWQVYQNKASLAEASAENERLIAEQGLSQSMLMMQFVDLDRPFDHGFFSMNLVFDEGAGGEPVHPYSNTAIGTFPTDRVPDGGTIGFFEYDPLDLETQTYQFVRRGDGVGITRLSQMLDLRSSEYIYGQNAADWPGFRPETRDQIEASYRWGFEYLATAHGSMSQGLFPDIAPPAGEILSKLTQQSHVGYFVLSGEASNRRLRDLIENHSNTHIRFIQSHTNSLAQVCTRSVYVNISVVRVDHDDELSGVDRCDRNDLCYGFRIQQPVQVRPCELPQI